MIKFVSQFSFFTLALIFFFGVSRSDNWVMAPVLTVFFILPALDLLVGTNQRNPTPHEKKVWAKQIYWLPGTFLYAISHFALLAYGLSQLTQSTWTHLLLLSLTVGLYTGGIGITVAHEMLHRRERFVRWTADLILASVCYQHFAVEHLHGHHLHVSTANDPASSKRGQSIYRFLLQTLLGSFPSAWKIERRRLNGKTLSLENRIIQGLALSAAFTVAAYASQGVQGLAFFALQSCVAILTLELVNYVEHYGLQRNLLSNGRLEKVTIAHSWNSAHRVSNALLFNLQRHSDHHANATTPFPALQHHEKAPQLPSGYPAMIILALIPAAWFKVMDARLEAYDKNL